MIRIFLKVAGNAQNLKKSFMENKIKITLNIFIIFGIISFVGASVWYVNSFSKSVSPSRTFSVTSEGKIIAIPDIAQLSFGVISEGGKNLSSLQKENSEKANQVITFLKEKGIEAKDIKTQSYNITPRYQHSSCLEPITEEKPCPLSEIVGYTINQTLAVKIRDLNKIGDILSGVVEKGANIASGPNFTIDDPNQLKDQARKEAIVKAKEKAKAIAEAGGFKLGKLISLNEGIYFPPPSPFMAKEAVGGGVPPIIEPGSQEISVNVTLTYEIK